MAAKRIQGITNSTVFLYNVQYLLFLVEDDLISSTVILLRHMIEYCLKNQIAVILSVSAT